MNCNDNNERMLMLRLSGLQMTGQQLRKAVLRLLAAGLIVMAFILAGYAVWLSVREALNPHVVINEVCSNNFSAVPDADGNYPDYIELYNPASEEITLEGMFLSDDRRDACQYALENMTIPAGGYAVIWLEADGQEGASFQISRDGEEIFLSDAAGKQIDSVAVPKLSYNTVYARMGDGEKKWRHMSPTPGSTNAQGTLLAGKCLEEPVFSAESGFYEDSFTLELEGRSGEQIYYTLDGSDPTKDSLLYEEPIVIGDASVNDNVYAARTDLAPSSTYTPGEKVDKATVVRAVSYRADLDAVSEIVTKTYFVGFEEKAEYRDMPVLSLVTEPDNLFDFDTGIYTNGAVMEAYKAGGGFQKGELLTQFTSEGGGIHHRYMASNAYHEGREWEREAVISWFDRDHRYCYTQNVGIRISGQSTRGAMQKSFKVYGRDIYDDQAEFPSPFWEGMLCSTIKLRNGGSENSGTKMMDAFLQSLAADRAVSVQASVPCVVFLDGEYWGIYNIRERYTEEYLADHYGVGEDNVWLIDAGTAGIGGEEAQDAYYGMTEWIAGNDMADPQNYEAAAELIDMQSLIDFYCINLYIDNMDVSFGQNMAVWRSIAADDSAYGDGRWRFMIYDVDGSMTAYDNNTFENSIPWEADYDLMDEALISSLMKNEGFREQFYESFLEIAETCFDYGTVHEKLMEWKEIYEKQVIKSHQRFFGEEFGQEQYDALVAKMDEFFQNRPSYILDYLRKELGMETGQDENGEALQEETENAEGREPE